MLSAVAATVSILAEFKTSITCPNFLLMLTAALSLLRYLPIKYEHTNRRKHIVYTVQFEYSSDTYSLALPHQGVQVGAVLSVTLYLYYDMTKKVGRMFINT